MGQAACKIQELHRERPASRPFLARLCPKIHESLHVYQQAFLITFSLVLSPDVWLFGHREEGAIRIFTNQRERLEQLWLGGEVIVTFEFDHVRTRNATKVLLAVTSSSQLKF